MAFAQLESQHEPVRIHYQLMPENPGSPALPVLVLSNSLGANLKMWESQLAALAPHVRILRYDQRGHGQSSVPTGPYTAADLGHDVLDLLDALAIEQVIFCGISMGGLTGQWLALNAPHRLHKLILANTAAKIGTAETWNTRIATVLQNGLGEVIPGTLQRWFTPGFHVADPEVIASTAAMLRATDPIGYANCCAAIRDADFRASLQQITIPTLVISGAQDPVTTPADAHFLASSIASATFIELPAAHLSNVEAAEQFNTALIAFLVN